MTHTDTHVSYLRMSSLGCRLSSTKHAQWALPPKMGVCDLAVQSRELVGWCARLRHVGGVFFEGQEQGDQLS